MFASGSRDGSGHRRVCAAARSPVAVVIARCCALVVWLLLPACGGDSGVAEDLPASVSGLSGDTYLVSWREPGAVGRAADAFDPLRAFVDVLGLRPSGDQDGDVHLRSDEVATGWDSLGDSKIFQAAWRARPEVAADRWLFCDLQCAVDLALLRLAELDPSAPRLAEALALPTLEWAIAGSRRAGPETLVDGRIRSSGSGVGLVALIGPPVGTSLLGPRRASDRLRVELSVQRVVARMMTDVWLSGDARLGSPADAVVAAFGPMLRKLVRQFDGQISFRIDEEGRFLLAAGIRQGAGEELAETLDRSLEEVDSYRWKLRGDFVVSIDGDRLLVSDGGVDHESDEVRREEALSIDGSAAVWIRLPGGERATAELRRDDEQTLSLRASIGPD